MARTSTRSSRRRGCACIRWSADGSQIWTVTETETALAYTTQDPDGGNRVVHVPDIPTLSLAPGFGSADGRHVAFFGWDDTDPTRAGVWTANTDLTDLHHVTPVPDGVLGIDPIGMSANGSHIYFHGDLGENTDNDFHHAGNVYVIAADGTGMRQLNPEGTKTESTGTGLSADGRRFAFSAWRVGHGADGNALFIVDGVDGEPVQVTDFGDRWGASWSPNGEWIGYSTSGDDAALISLIKPDGTGATAVTPKDLSEDITMPRLVARRLASARPTRRARVERPLDHRPRGPVRLAGDPQAGGVRHLRLGARPDPLTDRPGPISAG